VTTQADLDLLPDDDSLVRTAIRGLRVPAHHPDFWDQLAWQLDDAADEMVQQGLMEETLRAALLEPDAPEPTVHHVEDPWTESEEEAAAAHAAALAGHAHASMDLYAPVAGPDAAAAPAPVTPEAPAALEAHEPRRAPLRASTRVFVDAPPGAAGAPRVRHDPAVVPHALRRASNAVLLALVVAAAVLAVVAGLALVHSRSDAGPSTPTPVVHTTSSGPAGDVARTAT
jgi:hypothetical protein